MEQLCSKKVTFVFTVFTTVFMVIIQTLVLTNGPNSIAVPSIRPLPDNFWEPVVLQPKNPLPSPKPKPKSQSESSEIFLDNNDDSFDEKNTNVKNVEKEKNTNIKVEEKNTNVDEKKKKVMVEEKNTKINVEETNRHSREILR